MDTSYDLDICTKPYYEGDVVYYETCMFIGEESCVHTLFPIEEMISVLNYSLNEKYEEGIDYIFKGNTIQRLKGSRMPYFEPKDIFLQEPNDKGTLLEIIDKDILKSCPGAKYFLYGEQDTFTKKQIAVTYKHKEGEWKGTRAKYQGDKLSAFLKKIQNHEKATIVFTGDSITTGCDASGTDAGGNVPPYLDPYPVLVTKKLEKVFNSETNYINTAVGGTHADWGLDNIYENVNKYNPDLVVVAFGMNNPYEDEAYFEKWCEDVINKLTEHNKDVGIVMVSTTVPNPHCSWWGNQYKFGDVFNKISKPNVAVVDMTNTHLELMKAGKSYFDMTANNVNHPNDFIHRIYAQLILESIIKR